MWRIVNYILYYRERVHDIQRDDDYDAPWRDARQAETSLEQRLAARALLGNDRSHGRHFGRVRAAFIASCERRGKPWLLIHCSDHGDTNGAHKVFGKQTFYEGSARVPLLIEGSGIPHGACVESLCSLIDVAPTLCDAAGLDQVQCFEGQSLLPLSAAGDSDRRVISEYCYPDGPARMLRQGEWKLIQHHRAEGISIGYLI